MKNVFPDQHYYTLISKRFFFFLFRIYKPLRLQAHLKPLTKLYKLRAKLSDSVPSH